jgi:hypothetical protein
MVGQRVGQRADVGVQLGRVVHRVVNVRNHPVHVSRDFGVLAGVDGGYLGQHPRLSAGAVGDVGGVGDGMHPGDVASIRSIHDELRMQQVLYGVAGDLQLGAH